MVESSANYLKLSTKSWHSRTEKVAYSNEILHCNLSYVQYVDLIRKNFFIFSALENSLNVRLQQHPLPINYKVFLNRYKLLQFDLELLAISPLQFEVLVPHFHSLPRLLGGLYVYLGSALGGKLIHRKLKNTPQLEMVKTFYFFAGFTEMPPQLWPNFCRYLDQYLQEEKHLEEALQGAKACFRFFYEVYTHPISRLS